VSMISGQIDRLRTAAQTYRRLGNHSAESMLLDAADTIWKLRDDLQRANADNAKLREQVDAAHMSRLLTENENEELRELSARAWHLFTEHGAVHESDLPEVDAVRDKMHELGINVGKLADHDFAHNENPDGIELELADKLRMSGIEVDKWMA